ncbi:MAG TPA: toll/interleukin-1 receptor domain-containing protein [Acidimicrobiales bacterium]|nr:toll/interleukin-1 receptor domain-containing protein [Acidimicrobiales bacterium]
MAVAPFVFLSYRRNDAAHAVDHLRDELIDALGEGSVFMDETEIRPGRDYRTEIAQSIADAETVIVVVGDGWDVAQLADPKDDVRIEIEAAVKAGKFLLPVFVGNAGPPLPESLPESIRNVGFTQGMRLRTGRDFDRDVVDIVAEVRKASPATLGIDFPSPGFLMLGDLTISVDNVVVSRAKMRKGAKVPPTRVTVGTHTVTMSYTAAGGISRVETYPFEVKIGANHLRVTHSKASGKFGASVEVQPR